MYRKDGKYPDDVWDIPVIRGKERTGYPTQKPLALLHRIIKASSNEGDIVMDPFYGCATTCVAAQQLDRKWIGIDIEKQAVHLFCQRDFSVFSRHGAPVLERLLSLGLPLSRVYAVVYTMVFAIAVLCLRRSTS